MMKAPSPPLSPRLERSSNPTTGPGAQPEPRLSEKEQAVNLLAVQTIEEASQIYLKKFELPYSPAERGKAIFDQMLAAHQRLKELEGKLVPKLEAEYGISVGTKAYCEHQKLKLKDQELAERFEKDTLNGTISEEMVQAVQESDLNLVKLLSINAMTVMGDYRRVEQHLLNSVHAGLILLRNTGKSRFVWECKCQAALIEIQKFINSCYAQPNPFTPGAKRRFEETVQECNDPFSEFYLRFAQDHEARLRVMLLNIQHGIQHGRRDTILASIGADPLDFVATECLDAFQNLRNQVEQIRAQEDCTVENPVIATQLEQFAQALEKVRTIALVRLQKSFEEENAYFAEKLCALEAEYAIRQKATVYGAPEESTSGQQENVDRLAPPQAAAEPNAEKSNIEQGF